MMNGFRLCVLLGVLLACEFILPASEQRVLTPADLNNIERLEDARLSPSGEQLAYAITPSRSNRQSLEGGDIWIADLRKQTSQRIASASSERGGYFYPRWSPSGTRLAMLAADGKNPVRLVVWDQISNRLREVSDREVALW